MIEKLQEDLKQAMRDKDVVKTSTLRILLAEIKNAEISKGENLSDSDIISVFQKEAKKRKEAAAGFRQGNREDSALVEEQELKVIEAYLPEQLSDEELTKIVEGAITELGASSIQDMGKVIGLVMSKAQGKVEGARVSGLVKERLSS